MKTLSAIAFALVLATGGALAQGTGGSGGTGGTGSGGGTESGTSGMSTGKEAGAQPTAQDCAKGYQTGMRWSKSEFDAACKNK